MQIDLRGNQLDQDHQIQLNFIEILCESVCTSRDPEKIEMILEQFLAFTKSHFEAEALMMDYYNYPQSRAHQDEHKALVKSMDEIKSTGLKHKGDDLLNSLSSLQDQIRIHIGTMDTALDRFVNRTKADRERRAS